MILRKGMRVLVNATNIGHPPNRSYPVTAVDTGRDVAFLEGWWGQGKPLPVPFGWIWPLLDPGERVAVGRVPKSPPWVAEAHRGNAGIWLVERTICHDFFHTDKGFHARAGSLPVPSLSELPCVAQLVGVPGLFDPRFLDDPAGAVPAPLDAAALKAANTGPGARFCVACGSPLKDPGLGPAYRHCPRCEP